MTTALQWIISDPSRRVSWNSTQTGSYDEQELDQKIDHRTFDCHSPTGPSPRTRFSVVTTVGSDPSRLQGPRVDELCRRPIRISTTPCRPRLPRKVLQPNGTLRDIAWRREKERYARVRYLREQRAMYRSTDAIAVLR